MGGNLHRGFESLPLRSAHGCVGDLRAGRALAGPQVAEDAAEGAGSDSQAGIADHRVELPAVSSQVEELALPTLVLDVEPARRADGVPGGHARLSPLGPALSGVDMT